jgi:hypothetical protein
MLKLDLQLERYFEMLYLRSKSNRFKK